jgi:SAM-dependent methyltransferase
MAAPLPPVRTAIEELRLEFPGYRISQRVIGDQLFYLADAIIDGLQPRSAQAQTPGRLREQLRRPQVEITAGQPSIARVYDVLLGGKDNFEADRAQAARVLAVFPRSALVARQARVFQARALTTIARTGISQFLDVGCGLPTTPSTHETAQAARPEARVVYVDNDAQVLSHARNQLAKDPGVLAAAGDLAYPAEIIYDRRTRNFLDFGQPVCLILGMTMHFFPPDQATTITAEFIRALPPGSYVIMSVVGGQPKLGQDLARAYTAAPVYNHGAAGVARFMDGLELTGPGIVPAHRWPAAAPARSTRRGQAWAAVACKSPATGEEEP